MAERFHSLPPAVQHALLEGPAIPYPPGVKPNFDNPPNNNPLGWGVTMTAIVLSTIAMTLRLYHRVFLMKRLLLEDYLALAAFGSYIAFQYYLIKIAIYPGYFVHMWDIRLKDLSDFLYNLITCSTIHGVVIMLLKAAILFEFLRIFSPRGQRGAFFWTSHLIIWVNVLFYTICTFLELFGCTPREKLWNKLLPGGHCINVHALTVASSAINLPSDIIILILPQRSIWKLNLSRRKRLGLSAIFAIAIFACISAAFRLVESVPLLYSDDVLYIAARFGAWIQGEMAAGFLILGVPALPKIFKNSPFLQRLSSIMKSWTGSSISKVKTSSRKGLPSWYKPASPTRPRRERGWTDLYTNEDGSMAMDSIKSGVEVEGNDGMTSTYTTTKSEVEKVAPAHVRG